MPQYCECHWDSITEGLKKSHKNADKSIADSDVEHVSRFKWLVVDKSGKKESTYEVVRVIENANDHDQYECETCGENWIDQKYGAPPESICPLCQICNSLYSCSCPCGKSFCYHIHKVHSMNERLVDEQKPWTLKMTVSKAMEKVTALGVKMQKVKGNDMLKERFADSLFEFVDKHGKELQDENEDDDDDMDQDDSD